MKRVPASFSTVEATTPMPSSSAMVASWLRMAAPSECAACAGA